MTGLDEQIQAFRLQHQLIACVAISGTADDHPRVPEIVDAFLNEMRDSRIAIITSGTQHGVPRCTVDYAHHYGLPVIRVSPETAKLRGHLADVDVGLDISVPPRVGSSMWGDESEVFVKLADAMVFVGGSAGTLVEIAQWAKTNKTRASRKVPLIPAIPIAIGDGWSQWLTDHGAEAFPEFYHLVAPSSPVTTGVDAAKALKSRLSFS